MIDEEKLRKWIEDNKKIAGDNFSNRYAQGWLAILRDLVMTIDMGSLSVDQNSNNEHETKSV